VNKPDVTENLNAPPRPLQQEVGCVEDLKCRNGDTLTELLNRRDDWQLNLRGYRSDLDEAERKIRPLLEMIDEGESALANVECRIQIWMTEHGGKLKASND